MTDIPKVSARDWITVGKIIGRFRGPYDAVVCHVYDEPSPEGGDLEVVFLDETNRAISRHVKWIENNWEFIEGEWGGYADKYNRLKSFVQILRSGRR